MKGSKLILWDKIILMRNKDTVVVTIVRYNVAIKSHIVRY